MRRGSINRIRDGHQLIRAAADQVRSIGAPVNVKEGSYVALQDSYAPPASDVPQAQGAISTAEQAAAVGREGESDHRVGMSLQCPPITVLFDIPQPDRFFIPTTGQQTPIRTPGDSMHPLRMPGQRLVQSSSNNIPQFDRTIIARAGKSATVGGKRHTVNIPRVPALPDQLAAGHLPHLNQTIPPS